MSSTTSQTASHFLLSFPFLSLFCLGNQLVVATGYGVLHRLSWEGKFDSSLAIHLNQVPIGNDLLPESKGKHTQVTCTHAHTRTYVHAHTHTHIHTHTHPLRSSFGRSGDIHERRVLQSRDAWAVGGTL